MSLSLTAPVIDEYHLVETDKEYNVPDETPTLISVRKATNGDVESVERLSTTMYGRFKERETGGTDYTVERKLDFVEVRQRQVWLTLANCNITDVNGKPLFTFQNNRIVQDETTFIKKWAQLPVVVANEIYECVLKTNKYWSPEGEDY